MDAKRIIPYLIVLLVLAFALGSLPHGTAQGSLLFQSVWLLYLLYLEPIIVLGLMGAVIVIIAMNWRDIGTGIGHGVAQRRRRGKRSKYSVVISLLVWGVALSILLRRPGTLFNPESNSTANNQTIAKIVGASASTPNPFLAGGIVPAISNFLQNGWFGIGFLGLLIVGGLVLVQSVRVALRETSDDDVLLLEQRRTEGLEAVNNALEIIEDTARDPRTRIIMCYQQLMTVVSRLGAPLSSDLTARELEAAIQTTFFLRGNATHGLTQLFEEARYSLHAIKDDDAAQAKSCLESIADELQVTLDAK